ncbi:hypothetical protein M0802_016966, partial [Mischocyttarus mexicanus]
MEEDNNQRNKNGQVVFLNRKRPRQQQVLTRIGVVQVRVANADR